MTVEGTLIAGSNIKRFWRAAEKKRFKRNFLLKFNLGVQPETVKAGGKEPARAGEIPCVDVPFGFPFPQSTL
jgi:hypothetical protein